MLMFTNSAGLDILETTLINIQDMSLETVLGDECQQALFLELPKIMNQVMLTIINLPLLHLQHTFTGAMTKILELKPGRFASPLLSYQQGFANLPGGVCKSSMGRQASYEQAVAWKVVGDDGTPHCLTLMLVNWTFV
jgi:homeobox-leucine zipper protein